MDHQYDEPATAEPSSIAGAALARAVERGGVALFDPALTKIFEEALRALHTFDRAFFEEAAGLPASGKLSPRPA